VVAAVVQPSVLNPFEGAIVVSAFHKSSTVPAKTCQGATGERILRNKCSRFETLNLPFTPSFSPSEGERVAEGRVRGLLVASLKSNRDSLPFAGNVIRTNGNGHLSRSALARQRQQEALAELENCHLCGHHCGVNRWKGELGRCGAGVRAFGAQLN
jgi:hypothetical protein